MNFNFTFSFKKAILGGSIFIIILLAFVFGAWFGSEKMNYYVPQPGEIDFSLFWDAYGKLKSDFISPEKITDEKVIYGAIKGMAESFGDPYTSFFTPEQAKTFTQDLSGSFGGVGVEVGMKKGNLTVISPLKNSPGEKAGLKAGDIIVKVDGKSVYDLSAEESIALIRGPKGKEVTLTISRLDWDTTKDIKIVRDIITVPSIEWSMKDGNIAYIGLYQFNDNSSEQFKNIANEILQSPAKKIVLDLRNNPGGYLEAAQDIAGWFLEKGQVVTIEDYGKSKNNQIFKSLGNSKLSNYPIVVLINEGSASASEILAGALRDNRGVKLIGSKSFGKGSVQEVLDLRGGSFLKITIANWLTPKGASISEVGLTPDIVVERTEDDVEKEKDPQLDKALEIVSNLK